MRARRSHTLLVGCNSHLIEILRTLEALFRVFRFGILEIQIVDSQCSGCACAHIRCTGIGLLGLCLCSIGFRIIRLGCSGTDCCRIRKDILLGAEVSRSCKIKHMLALEIRADPVVMVDIALADLIDISQQLAVLVVVERFQIKITESMENILDMLLVACFFVCLTEFVIAPAERRSRIGARQTEFDMVAGIVHTALAVETAVSVRIKLCSVLFDPCVREIDALEVFTVLLQRNVLILHVAVAAPFQNAGALAALVGIIECHRVLQTSCKVYIHIVVGKAVRIRKCLFRIVNCSRILARGRACLDHAGTGHDRTEADTECSFQETPFLFHKNPPSKCRHCLIFPQKSNECSGSLQDTSGCCDTGISRCLPYQY